MNKQTNSRTIDLHRKQLTIVNLSYGKPFPAAPHYTDTHPNHKPYFYEVAVLNAPCIQYTNHCQFFFFFSSHFLSVSFYFMNATCIRQLQLKYTNNVTRYGFQQQHPKNNQDMMLQSLCFQKLLPTNNQNDLVSLFASTIYHQ